MLLLFIINIMTMARDRLKVMVSFRVSSNVKVELELRIAYWREFCAQ